MSRSLIVLPLLLVGSIASGYEEPAYEVIEKREGYELRRYSSYIVAETAVESDFRGAASQAFRRLFGYLTGNNRSADTMDATASVVSVKRSEKIEMTIPVVTTTPDETDGTALYTYYFVMPSDYTLETLPRPLDPRIELRELPARTVAVRRYSGRSNESNYRENRELLLQDLRRDGIVPEGEAVLAVYNGPATPWFMRRNEVMVDIRP